MYLKLTFISIITLFQFIPQYFFTLKEAFLTLKEFFCSASDENGVSGMVEQGRFQIFVSRLIGHSVELYRE